MAQRWGDLLDQLLKKRDEVMRLPCKKLLVVGEVGDGKSTLVNQLRHSGEEAAEAGLNPAGITKLPGLYFGRVRGEDVVLIDTPGIGDRNVRVGEVVAMIELALETGQVDGVILCNSVFKNRVTIGAQVVQKIIELGVRGDQKWEKVILCGTHADRCGPAEVENFLGPTLCSFNGRASGGGQIRHAAVVQIPPQRGGKPVDISLLEDCILNLQGPALQYTAPSPDVLGRAVAGIFGVPEQVAEVVADIAAGRRQCFAMSSSVRMQSGKLCPIRELKPGDLIMDKGGYTRFVGFFHICEGEPTVFVSICAFDACVRATPSHLLMVARASSPAGPSLVPAGAVQVGDFLLHSSGVLQKVDSVTLTSELGYLGPLTQSGTLFVDDLLASCYIDIPGLSVGVMHAATFPLRAGLLSLTAPDKMGTKCWYVKALEKLIFGSAF